MQIVVDVEESIYDRLKVEGIDVQNKIKEYLKNLLDDGAKTISMTEAKKRVSEAVQRYENNTGKYLNEDEYNKELNKFLEYIKWKSSKILCLQNL